MAVVTVVRWLSKSMPTSLCSASAPVQFAPRRAVTTIPYRRSGCAWSGVKRSSRFTSSIKKSPSIISARIVAYTLFPTHALSQKNTISMFVVWMISTFTKPVSASVTSTAVTGSQHLRNIRPINCREKRRLFRLSFQLTAPVSAMPGEVPPRTLPEHLPSAYFRLLE